MHLLVLYAVSSLSASRGYDTQSMPVQHASQQLRRETKRCPFAHLYIGRESVHFGVARGLRLELLLQHYAQVMLVLVNVARIATVTWIGNSSAGHVCWSRVEPTRVRYFSLVLRTT